MSGSRVFNQELLEEGVSPRNLRAHVRQIHHKSLELAEKIG